MVLVTPGYVFATFIPMHTHMHSNMYIDINLSATIGGAIFKKMCKLWYVFFSSQNNWAH